MTPKLTEKTKFYSFKRQSSFGIRKFTIGVVSVSLGTALVATAPAASADTLEPASSALAAPSAELVSQVTADKTALAQALSVAQAIDLSQQAPEVAEGFVELFVRASALLEQTGAAQAELDALTQELQQATVALTAELPTAVGTPVEVVEADAFLPTVIEEETPAVAEREEELALSTMTAGDPVKPAMPAILYPTSREDFDNQSGARVDILTPEGQAMGLSEALDGGNGVDIKRKVRIIMPAGVSNQVITVNLGGHLTFINGGSIRVGGMTIDGQSAGMPYSTKNSVTYRHGIAGSVAEFDVIFNVERNVQNLRVLGLSSDADATNTRLRQDAIAAGGFVEARPLLVTYRYTLNGKQSELKTGINTLYFPEPLTLGGQKINSPSESSYASLVASTMRKAMAEGTLPIALYDTDMTNANGSKTLFTIDAKVGTVIDEAWSPDVFVPIPRIPGVLPTTPNGTTYDVGSLGLSDLSGKMLSEDLGLANEVIDYLNKRLVQLDEVYLSGVNKKLSDYGLRLEVDAAPQPQAATMGFRRAGIGNHLSEHYYGSLHVSVPTYRLRGTLRLPEGTVGNVAQTTWKDLFHIPLFGGVSRDSYIDDIFMHRLPGAKEDNTSEYSKLSYTLNYSDAMWEGTGVQSRSIRWGSAEFPLLTSVRVYDDSRQSQAEVYQPTAVASGVTLGANDRPDPAQFVANRSDLPNDTRYEFTEPVAALIAGTSKLVGVKVTFADGSVATVYTLLKVRAIMAQQYMPEAQSLRLSRGASLRPVDFIKNASSLPADTRYSWAQEPSTQVVGSKVARVTVTYSDGSTDTITVRFTVR